MPTNSRLWRTTLESRQNDTHAAARERLRANYEACRNFSAAIAAEISRDNPSYTVHDITHMDALWELAELIAGAEYSLTPAEGFVMGCAMLIHDLAMGMAAFPDGEAKLIGNTRWLDTVYVHLKDQLGRQPTSEELQHAPNQILEAAKRELLRDLHAEQAERLTHEQFRDRRDDSIYFLIQDPDLRNMYGDIIGRIAASHGWDHKRLAEEFDTRLGSPAALPREWTVDPLKLACLLRVADASHLDSRRAPGFLRALRRLDSGSRSYWIFQERLNRPWLDGDRLVYTASQPFSAAESEAWWLCIDTLRMVDRELRTVDVLLADTTRPRFAAHSVAYIDDLERLARYIPVRDWFPIDAKIQVGDVIDLVRKLGGEKLYGDDPSAALRELISNAADAIRARRAIENPEALGELRLRVAVEMRSEDDKRWLIVRDNGVGMSREVMSGPLLDFGKSYWISSSAREDFPGLISSGFSPTGTFGIGFFSVFMLGDRVRVSSRRFDLGVSDTHVLIFNSGLSSRPLLRRATPQEFLPYGGTEVAVELHDRIPDGLLNTEYPDLGDLCSWLCPTIDINLDVVSEGGSMSPVVEADDWMTCSAGILIGRLGDTTPPFDKSSLDRLRPIGGAEEQMKGRAAIAIASPNRRSFIGGGLSVITVGGMRSYSYMSHIIGVVVGSSLNAARNSAAPLAHENEFAVWATHQARLVPTDDLTPEQQLNFASVVCAFNGDPGELTIAQARCGFMNSAEIAEWATGKEVVFLYQDAALSITRTPRETLDENVLVVDMGVPGIYQFRGPGRGGMLAPGIPEFIPRGESLESLCARIIFRAWDLPELDAERQLREHYRIVNAYSEARRKAGGESIDARKDPDYPFRVEIATKSSGARFIDTVTPLVRRGQ